MTLVLREAHARLGQFRLGPISLQAAAGEVTAILGPNGCGKSTLLRSMCGLQELSAGEVVLEGLRVHRMSVRARPSRIAFVPQRPLVPPAMTVREAVELGRLSLVPDRGAVEAAMQECGVAGYAAEAVDTLSEGQRHRVAFARALSQRNPRLRLFAVDEPTASLDPAWCGEIASAVRRLASGGMAVMVATHDFAFAAACCSRAVLLVQGRAVAEGPFADVATPERLGEAFAARFESLPRPDGGLVVLPRWRRD